VDPTPFIDPLLGDAEETEGVYRTPQSELDRIMGGGASGRRSASVHEMEGRFQTHRGGYQGEQFGGSLGAQMHGRGPTLRHAQGGPGFGIG
jgi:hypothetical protein